MNQELTDEAAVGVIDRNGQICMSSCAGGLRARGSRMPDDIGERITVPAGIAGIPG